MRCKPQPCHPGFLVELAELIGRPTSLIASDADPHDARILLAQLCSAPKDSRAFFNPKMADGVYDPEKCGPKLSFSAFAPALDGATGAAPGPQADSAIAHTSTAWVDRIIAPPLLVA